MAKPPKPPSTRSGAYAVGYSKPPKGSQFKAGKSGNPRGASKKVRARKADGSASPLDQSLLDEIKRILIVNENGKQVKISTARAISRGVAIAAVKGNRQSQKLIFDRAEAAHERRHTAAIERFGLIVQYYTSHAWGHNGLASPANRDQQVWPHPIDIELDYLTHSSRVVGPISVEQARPFIALLDEHRVWQTRLSQVLATASKSKGDSKDLCDAAVSAITTLLDSIHFQMPPSFKVQLDWEDSEVPAGAMDIEGLNEGEIVNLANIGPGSDEMAYANYQLVLGAMEASKAVRGRVALNIDANTTSLINRLQIEKQNRDGGAPPPPAVPGFAQLYDAFASDDHSNADGTAP